MSRAPVRLSGVREGTVERFDTARGLGIVAQADGERFGFHCVELADGSRQVEAGARVVFALGTGHAGALEARRLVKV